MPLKKKFQLTYVNDNSYLANVVKPVAMRLRIASAAPSQQNAVQTMSAPKQAQALRPTVKKPFLTFQSMIERIEGIKHGCKACGRG